TQITIGSIQEKTVFHEFVERYWKTSLFLAAAATIGILIPNYYSRKARQSHHETWDELETVAGFGGAFGQIQAGSPAPIGVFADQHRQSPVGAWAKALEVGSDALASALDKSAQAAAQIASLWPDHLLSKAKLYPDGDSTRTLAEEINARKLAL